jgi:prepilin-type N-terminal cleavage/methylation domain-containing protein
VPFPRTPLRRPPSPSFNIKRWTSNLECFPSFPPLSARFPIRRWAFGVRRFPPLPAPQAFTLFELLIVIAIIAILGGLAFPVYQGVIDRAKRVQAKNDLTQIVTAVNAYYTEYGRMPIPGSEADGTAGYTYGDTSVTGVKHSNDWLFNVLRPTPGLSGEQLNENPKLVSFITPPIAKDPNIPKGGLAQAGSLVNQWCDPWGSVYNIRLDSAYANSVSSNPPYTNAPSSNVVMGTAIAWSYGKDQQLGARGNGDANASGFDDVLSWQ